MPLMGLLGSRLASPRPTSSQNCACQPSVTAISCKAGLRACHMLATRQRPLRVAKDCIWLQGNRKYVKCLYVYNKIDVCSIEEVDAIAR